MSRMLSIGASGLNVSKKALETTGHNLSNANTEGYSRQRVDQTTNTPQIKGGIPQGTGARITQISRVQDPFLEKNLNDHLSKQTFHKERTSQLEQVEAIFNENDNEGLNNLLNRFYNSFRELAAQPENETIRSIVRDNALSVVNDIHRIRETLDNVASNIDKRIAKDIVDLNQVMHNIAKLNKSIASLEATSAETGDLRDQRDQAIRELSKSFNIHTYQDEKNRFVVVIKGVGTLVAGGEVQELATATRGKEESANKMAGSCEVFFKERPTFPVTNKFRGGMLSAQIDIRNNQIRRMQEDIDSIAFEFANTINTIHQRGFVNRNIEMDEAGNPLPYDARSPVTNINFFKPLQGVEGAASQLDLSNEIKSDLTNIVTSQYPNSPGDNSISLAISKLQHERIFGEGTATLEEKYLQMIATIGQETGKSRLDAEQSEGILAQAQAVKDRTSGVSIDEETANMIRYQHAYEASAKVLKSADEMFKTILSIKN